MHKKNTVRMGCIFLFQYLFQHLQNRQYARNRQITIQRKVQNPSVKQLIIIPTATKKRANPHKRFNVIPPLFLCYTLLYAGNEKVVTLLFFFFYSFYSCSTITNQFCLEIICCRVCFSFDFLIYPYYPAYMS